MKMDEDNYFAHYGTPRKSGRYPWGIGGDVVAKNNNRFVPQVGTKNFLAARIERIHISERKH